MKPRYECTCIQDSRFAVWLVSVGGLLLLQYWESWLTINYLGNPEIYVTSCSLIHISTSIYGTCHGGGGGAVRGGKLAVIASWS
jgi:hypothetical protein